MKIYDDLFKENLEIISNCSEDKRETFNSFLSFVDKNYSWDNLTKIASARCYAKDLVEKNDGELKIISNDYRKYLKNNKARIDDECKNIKKADISKFQVSGIWEVLMFSIVFMYMGAAATKSFVINGLVDGVVATIAMAVAVKSMVWRFKIGKRNEFPGKIFKFELFTIIFCFVIKLITANILDITFIFLVAMFYFTKKNAEKLLEDLNN